MASDTAERSEWRTDDRSTPRLRSTDSAFDAAVKLLGETAHDLRSSLAGAREAIRIVRDGEAGPVTPFQLELLGDALGQCDAIHQLADNMLRAERIRNGVPASRRVWLSPIDVRASVESVLSSIALPRRVSIVWLGFDTTAANVYGDIDLLRRLVINLAGNAIAISDEGDSVLISLEPSMIRGMQRLSVADQGPGMSSDSIAILARRGHSGTGSTGLGLAICRGLAALHFGRLSIVSKLGRGTKIGIDLPAAGPAAVADAFARWREIVAPPKGNISLHARPADQVENDHQSGNAKLRVDDPAALVRGAYKGEMILPYDGLAPRSPEFIQVLGLRAGEQLSMEQLAELDSTLQREQRLHELVYRTDSRRWIMFWDADRDELDLRIAKLNRTFANQEKTFDVEWTAPRAISVSHRSDRATLRDMLVRDSLFGHSRTPLFDDRESRTGVPEPTSDETSERRLEAELRHLGKIMRKQTNRLRDQAERLSRHSM